MNKKCEICESLSTFHVEAVIRQLQHAMALHGALRLGGDTGEVTIGVSDTQEKTLDAWVRLSGHLGEHSLNSTAA
jgi:hypothetical protein